MLYLSNGSRDQKKKSKSTSLALKFVKDGVMNERHVKSVSCYGDVKNVESSGYSKSNNPLKFLFSLK